MVDMYPTLAGLSGRRSARASRSPRTEVVYDIEPFRAALRVGNWKLVWQATLPSRVELFDLAKDPGEKTDLSEKHPEKRAELQKRIETLSREAAKPLLLEAAIQTTWSVLFGSVALPAEEKELELEP